ncbi:MAG: hypothetical protein F6K14_05965 [Symploca sp. SIO2C1]|nr:hypothetical protein [Symploca sp. SIO2C1]
MPISSRKNLEANQVLYSSSRIREVQIQFPIPNSQFPIPNSQKLGSLYLI